MQNCPRPSERGQRAALGEAETLANQYVNSLTPSLSHKSEGVCERFAPVSEVARESDGGSQKPNAR